MSQSKFAPVTSSLLVRKGEAGPSRVLAAERAVTWLADAARRVETDASEHKFVYSPDESSHGMQHGDGGHYGAGEKPRRIVLNLTPHEYETLGLVAVKKGSSRHRLAQEALDAYFEWLVAEYGEACTCIAGGALCRCECGSH